MEYDATFTFALESRVKMLQDLRRGLRTEIDSNAVAPFLGTFTNDALGAVSLSLRDGVLTFDAGKFTVRLRPWEDEQGRPRYLVSDRQLTGLALQFRRDDGGNPVIVLQGTPLDTYTFERVT